MKKYKVPKSNAMWARVAVEICALLVLIYPMAHIYLFLHGDKDPYERGFFCDDESIKHPIVEEEIPETMAFVIWAVIVFLLVPAIELLHVTVYTHLSPTPLGKWGPWLFIELYRILGYFILGGLFTLLTTEMAKFKVGRLRPYFLTVCKPVFSETECKDENGYYIFVTPDKYNCTGNPEEVREARKSFLSGHTSLSFYTATFLVVYIQARLRRMGREHFGDSENKSAKMYKMIFSGLKILRPFLQFGIISLAGYIMLTRISDYKHHPLDVLTGMAVGVFYAIMIMIVFMDFFHRPRSFKMEECADADEQRGYDNDHMEHSTVVDGVDGMRMRSQNHRKASTSSDSSQPLARTTTTDPQGARAPQSENGEKELGPR